MTASSFPGVAGGFGDDRDARLCILFVEDNEADSYLIGRALGDNPAVAEVVHAWDGEQAIAMVEAGEVTPDLALIDLHMPRMDGFDVLVSLANNPKLNFPMVVLTSSSAPSDAIRSRLRNAMRVIIKPDTVAELYAVLKTAIEATCRPSARIAAAQAARSSAFQLTPTNPPGLRRQPIS